MAFKSDSTKSKSVDRCRQQSDAWDEHLEYTDLNKYVVVEFKDHLPTYATVSSRWITRREDGSVGCFYIATGTSGGPTLAKLLNTHPQAFRDGDPRVVELELSRLPLGAWYHTSKLLSWFTLYKCIGRVASASSNVVMVFTSTSTRVSSKCVQNCLAMALKHMTNLPYIFQCRIVKATCFSCDILFNGMYLSFP
jgi:hypothetical protein